MTQDPNSSTPTIKVADLTGRELGTYVLLRRLGRGGMADVYLAHQRSLDRAVAIKVLKPNLALDTSYVARFHREAQAAAKLVQANIVQIYEVGEIDGIHFIAQEYISGQNLRQYLNRNSIVEPILAVSILQQVAAALQKASDSGVIHRDIKPENIMLSANGEVKVTDFGLARVMDDNRADLTQIGMTMGTPLYMSPEQAEGSLVDTRSDLYSLGITAWHMFTGRPPFEGENSLAIALKHVQEKLVRLESVRPDLPVPLCDIVHKLASKKPDKRYQSPADLTKDLRKLDFDDIADWEKLSEKLAVEDLTTGVGLPTQLQSRLEVTRQLETMMSGQFRRWWQSPRLVIGLLMMALAGAVGGWYWANANPPSDPLAFAFQLDGHIPKMKTVAEQYFYAYDQSAAQQGQSGEVREDRVQYNEKLWLAVKAYFPPSSPGADEDENAIRRLYGNLALVRMGELYLIDRKSVKAIDTFEELAALPETDREFRLTGLAGLSLAYDYLNEVDKITATTPELIDADLDQLKSEYIQRALTLMLERRWPASANRQSSF